MDTSRSTYEHFQRLMMKRSRSRTPPSPSSSNQEDVLQSSSHLSEKQRQKRPRRNSSPRLPDLVPPSPAPLTAVSHATAGLSSSHTNDDEGLSLSITHATIINGKGDLPRPHLLGESQFETFSETVATLAALEVKLARLNEEASPESDLQLTLLEVEDGAKSLREALEAVRQSNVTAPVIKEMKASMMLLETRLKDLRSRHPDTTAVRIDNRKYFVNPNSRRQTPTLIAYCIALVGRVFEGVSERGASFLLKLLKIFGHSLIMLGPEGESVEQSNAINDIPNSISTLEGRLNLGISTIPYAVCPSCSCIYEPTYAIGSSQPVYDRIEEFGDRFCQHISANPENPPDKQDARDGKFVRNLQANDGSLFVADRGEEGRWLFRLHGDSFNVEGNRIRGPKNSTGVLGLLCLNLPLHMTNDPAYIYLPGLIQGPNEPDAKEAAHSYYLRPLLRDLGLAYTRGVAPYHSYRNRTEAAKPYARVHRVAVANAVMDLKAARPHAGLLDASSHHFCFIYFENWGTVDDEFLRHGATLWGNARTKGERDRIEDIYGTRQSAMWMLKYWKPSEQLVPEPMHTFIMRVLQNFFRKALGLEDPDGKNVPSRRSFRAYHYDFTPPPQLSNTASTGWAPQMESSAYLGWLLTRSDGEEEEDHRFSLSLKEKSTILMKEVQKREMANSLVKWRVDGIKEQGKYRWPFFTPQRGVPPKISWAERPETAYETNQETASNTHDLSSQVRTDLLKLLSARMNHHSAHGIGDVHRKLQQPLETPLEKALDSLTDSLRSETWNSLAYVCVDLNRLPSGVSVIKKDHLTQQLVQWRRGQPFRELEWTRIDSSAVLQRLHHVISETITPGWVTKPPTNVGLPKAGTLKADHWRTLFSIHLPLTLLSLWGKGSPLQTSDAEKMSSVLETALLLSCALIVMTKDTITAERRDMFRHLYRLHVLGLRENFPGFFMPSHHLAFHVYEFMDLFSTVRNWWAFFFERLIGRLQRIPSNHKVGQFERTILHSFNSGASFRQWLLRPDCPPLLTYCLKILDQTYLYVRRGHSVAGPDDSQEEEEEEEVIPDDVRRRSTVPKQPDYLKWLIGSPPSPQLISACSIQNSEDIRCFSRITAPRGFYTVPSARGIGSSYICFEDRGGDSWSAGQVQHIFDYGDGNIRVAVKRCRSLTRGTGKDPFSLFWSRGFEAKLVSSRFEKELEILSKDKIIGHIARWELSESKAVVLSLARVRLVV
ncbi:hypothetical protein K435DRAFT_797315 [Dendrothele bispora CBS 962.96]|uniref:Uncharacterized protein n=1 Tax=Dendrothele bispora (strain CBS 962.96) TaxID=1314807 RepID=A0A4S8M3Y8_DENBC|nr:hypothetical protein K435DRAFT_797315 [Dendrothele bispora CBS 962.96]